MYCTSWVLAPPSALMHKHYSYTRQIEHSELTLHPVSYHGVVNQESSIQQNHSIKSSGSIKNPASTSSLHNSNNTCTCNKYRKHHVYQNYLTHCR